jgi:Tfp pilus assembly protein PilX
MRKESKAYRHEQTGAATLLIALVLMTSITIVTLAVARTLLVEQRMANNSHWHGRLMLQAEAGLAKGLAYLTGSMHSMSWKRTADNDTLTNQLTLSSPDSAIQTSVVFSRQAESDRYISVQVTSSSDASPSLRAGISQYVRPLSVLTPLGETAPPLIINGCLTAMPIRFDVRPLNADSAEAGDSIWFDDDRRCPTLRLIDTHNGRVRGKKIADDLWRLIFSVSREAFEALSTEQSRLADGDRNYWFAKDSDLDSGRWIRSLGSADRPVALHFPAAIGCPEFADGVRLYGVVFIDTGCPDPITAYGFEVFGALIINGNLNTAAAKIRLNHIQQADTQHTRLQFPVLRSVPVAGTWKDF